MSTVITMPQKGLTEESSVIAEFLVKEGDTVTVGQPLFSIETGKATFEVESEAAGTVLGIFCAEGDDVAIKAPVLVVGEPGESFERPAGSATPAPAAESAPAAAPAAAAPVSVSAPKAAENEGFASPRAKAAAGRANVDWRDAAPTGPEGRVIERDIAALVANGGKSMIAAKAVAAAEEEEFEIVKNSGIRKVIAQNMHDSLANMAQLSFTAYFDATELFAYREKVKAMGEKLGYPNISINDMILFAVSRTVLDYPIFNAHFSDKETKIFHRVHLGVATNTERGLMVPTLFNADLKSLNMISREAKALSQACRENTITPDQLSGGTITVTNLGNNNISSFTPVINPPQTCIVGVCSPEWRVRPGKDGEMEMYRAMGISLTFDHRAVDGAPAAEFLNAFCRRLENFPLLLAE
ncbi:MAG: dihydrolipoamide acetyltransferase family protein [Eubacteriales bacterium]|nr:dihydrolipoamide acetyltransferase family protein [Eubacteriales bacterium]